MQTPSIAIVGVYAGVQRAMRVKENWVGGSLLAHQWGGHQGVLLQQRRSLCRQGPAG